MGTVKTAEGAFNGAEITKVTFPEGFTSIAKYSFKDCHLLESVDLPKTIVTVGAFAFCNCKRITSIEFKGNVKNINKLAFYNTRLTKITVPKSVTTIGEMALGYRLEVKDDEDRDYAYTNFVIYGYSRSVAATYAKENGFTFKTIKKVNTLKLPRMSQTCSASNTKAQYVSIGATATGGTIKYKSSNTKVKVSSAGKITVPKNYSGITKITVSVPESSKYEAAVSKTFTLIVKPCTPTLSSVKVVSAKTIKAAWKKNVTGTGYQVQYALNSQFSSGLKSVKITSNATVSKQIAGLTKGKTYYVRIRSYKAMSGKMYYSGWSNVKSIKVTQ